MRRVVGSSGCHGRRCAVFHEQFQEQHRVARIVFGPARRKRFAEASQLLWIDRVEHKQVVLQQSIDKSAFGLLQTDRDQSAGEAFSQSGHPPIDRFGSLLQLKDFARLATNGQHTRVLRVGPIQRDECGHGNQFWRKRFVHHTSPFRVKRRMTIKTRWLWLCEDLIVESLPVARPHLSDSLANQSASLRSKLWAQSSSNQGRQFVAERCVSLRHDRRPPRRAQVTKNHVAQFALGRLVERVSQSKLTSRGDQAPSIRVAQRTLGTGTKAKQTPTGFYTRRRVANLCNAFGVTRIVVV